MELVSFAVLTSGFTVLAQESPKAPHPMLKITDKIDYEQVPTTTGNRACNVTYTF